MIDGYHDKSNKFDEAIATIAVTCADQNELDYQLPREYTSLKILLPRVITDQNDKLLDIFNR